MQANEVVIHHLESHGVRYARSGDGVCFCFDMDNCVAHCRLILEDGGLRVLIGGNKCTRDRIPEMLRYVAFVNRHVRSGCFQLDETDRELRYANCALFKEGELADGMVEGLIGCAIFAYDRYLPGALRVAYGGGDPIEEANACMEAGQDEDEADDQGWMETMQRLMGESEEGIEDLDDGDEDGEPDEPDGEEPFEQQIAIDMATLAETGEPGIEGQDGLDCEESD